MKRVIIIDNSEPYRTEKIKREIFLVIVLAMAILVGIFFAIIGFPVLSYVFAIPGVLALISIFVLRPEIGILALFFYDLAGRFFIESPEGSLVAVGIGNGLLLVLLFFIGFLYKPFFKTKTPINGYIIALMGIAILYALVGLSRSNKLTYVVGDFNHFFISIGFGFFVTISLVTSYKRLKTFSTGLLIISFLCSAFIIALYLTGTIRFFPSIAEEYGVSGLFRLGTAGAFPSFFLIFCICFWIYTKKRMFRVLQGVTILMLFALLIIGLHRTSWFSFSVSLLFSFIMAYNKLKARFTKITIALILLILCIGILLVQKSLESKMLFINYFSKQFITITKFSNDVSFQERMVQNKGLIEYIAKNPFGYGLGCSFPLSTNISGDEVHTFHNVFLRLFIQIGFWGVSIYYLTNAIVLWEGIKLSRIIQNDLLKAIIIASMAFLIGALVEGFTESTSITVFHPSIAMGLIFAVERIYNERIYKPTFH